MKAIFLDIDGVLQPRNNQRRFDHLKKIEEDIERLNITHAKYADWHQYLKCCGEYDITAVLYDWDQKAVMWLRNLLKDSGAKIILSTDWRYKGEKMMMALLSLYGLDKYYYDSTYFIDNYYNVSHDDPDFEKKRKAAEVDKDEYSKLKEHMQEEFNKVYPPFEDPKKWFTTRVDERAIEIREYLDRHPEITSYITIDDRDLVYGLDGHAIVTDHDIMDQIDYYTGMDILAKEDGPFPLPESCKTPELEAWRKAWIK